MTARQPPDRRRQISESFVIAPQTTRPASARLPRPARRRQLLGAAREVFVAQGYHAAAMDESVAELVGAVSAALASTGDNKERVPATFRAFFDYVSGAGEAFRLVFESDLSNEQAVKARLDRPMYECAEMVSEFIRADAGVSDAEADLLGIAMVGMAQVSARYW